MNSFPTLDWKDSHGLVDRGLSWPPDAKCSWYTIPTLLLSGSFDPGTPTSWARTLPNSTVADFAGIGHFVTGASPCAQRVFASFLATPSAPDSACVTAVRPPTFAPAPAARPQGPARG